MRMMVVLLVLVFAGFVTALASTLAQGLPPQQGLPQMLDPSMLANQQTIWITTLVGFASTIAAIIASMVRESRNAKAVLIREARQREWDLEDRRMAREQTQAALVHQVNNLKQAALTQAEVVRHAAIQEATKVRRELLEAASLNRETTLNAEQILRQDIKENTQISQHAFKEANDINKKIAHMQELFDVASPARDAANTRRDAADTRRDAANTVRDAANTARDAVNTKMSEQVDETHTVVIREFPTLAAASPSKQTLHDIQELAEETKDAVAQIVEDTSDKNKA